jgi:hypothetical protein
MHHMDNKSDECSRRFSVAWNGSSAQTPLDRFCERVLDDAPLQESLRDDGMKGLRRRIAGVFEAPQSATMRSG